jgi:membrane-bound lytic murein transglycosylase F
MTEHRNDTSVGDLAELQKRGSIRVLLRNNAINYFVYKGVQQGFEYELLKQFAKDNGLRIDVVVPPEQSDVIPWLKVGRGDIIATEMTVTDERKKDVAFTAPYLVTDEVLVQKSDTPAVKTIDELKASATASSSGPLSVAVRRSSSYAATLDALGIKHFDAPEDAETELLIAKVAAGELAATVADSGIAAVETRAHKGAVATLAVRKGDQVALGVRRENTALLASLDAWLKRKMRTGDFAYLKRKYFEARPGWDAAHVDVRVTGVLSPYDAQIKKWSQLYGLD